MSNSSGRFRRPHAAELARRLDEPRRFIQVVAGARQVGKTTLVQQVAAESTLPVRYASADEPAMRGPDWVAQQWEAARFATGSNGAILVLDEIQKAAGWSESVKRLWDEDTHANRPLKVVLLGSAPLLVQQGLTESLAGRFEVLHLPHWSFGEMHAAFGSRWTSMCTLEAIRARRHSRAILIAGDGTSLIPWWRRRSPAMCSC